MASADTSGPLSSGNLSKADVAEIRKFAHGKSRIEEYIHQLSLASSIDAFDRFRRIDQEELSTERIQEVWRDLDDRIRQALAWEQECDLIEAEVSKLEVEDMDKLRALTKAALQREMSAEDTDLMEIAIQSIAALDTLHRSLASRQRSVAVLQARLGWEKERRKCWAAYLALKRDFDSFVNLSGRWRAPRVRSGTGSSAEEGLLEVASHGTRSLGRHTNAQNDLSSSNPVKQQAAFLQGEVSSLARRCNTFIVESVPSTDRHLHMIIEKQQVPNTFLDEQDRLDDLSEAVKARLRTVAELSRQWRWADKSDDLYRLLETLKIDTKALQEVDDVTSEAIPKRKHSRDVRSDESCISSEGQSSSIASLSSVESLGDVFLVPETPPSTRMPPPDRRVVSAAPIKPPPPVDTLSDKVDVMQRRVVSDGAALRKHQLRTTPSRSRLPVPNTPRMGARTPTSSSTDRRTPVTPSNRPVDGSCNPASTTPLSVPKPVRRRHISMTNGKGPNRYRANPKSKLDVAVGRIVNEMPIPVSITHAAAASSKESVDGASTDGDRERWHDESGRYYVGHPDPKLCFCRILRSRTVMVRIGGGWEELSSYIIKHYAHLAPTDSLSSISTPQRSPQERKASGTFDGPPWISSASKLSTPTPTTRSDRTTPRQSPEASFSVPNCRADMSPSEARIARGASVIASTAHSPLSGSYAFPGTSADVDSMSPERMRAFWLRKDKKPVNEPCSPSAGTLLWPRDRARRSSTKPERLRAVSNVN